MSVELAEYRRYAQTLQGEANRFGLRLNAEKPVEDDDAWAEKISLLTAHPVPWVSITFGIPSRDDIAQRRAGGSITLQSVTSANEARAAVAAGIDAIIVQAHTAGGHSATLTPDKPLTPTPLPVLVNVIRQQVDVPIIAAGGIARPDDVAAAIHADADAVMVGTALLRAEESGASAPYQAALANPDFTETVMTKACTGRPARALRNYFIDHYEEEAPSGYPGEPADAGQLGRHARRSRGDSQRGRSIARIRAE